LKFEGTYGKFSGFFEEGLQDGGSAFGDVYVTKAKVVLQTIFIQYTCNVGWLLAGKGTANI
jgi:hypothetical protein